MPATRNKEPIVFHSIAHWRAHYGIPEDEGVSPWLPYEDDPRNLSAAEMIDKLLKERPFGSPEGPFPLSPF